MKGDASVKWLKLDKNPEVTGHIAYYYSDQKAELPIRGIRKQCDSKADPNIETRTYGLFTTCMPPARKNIVERGDSYLFLFTKWKGQRMFTGYYELDEYIDTGLTPKANGKDRKFRDLALRAKRLHFVRNGIPLEGDRWKVITADSFNNGHIDAYGPRDFKQIDADMTRRLKKMLDKQQDITNEYVKEIKRLEEENFRNYGYRYPSWLRKEGFSDEHIRGFIKIEGS